MENHVTATSTSFSSATANKAGVGVLRSKRTAIPDTRITRRVHFKGYSPLIKPNNPSCASLSLASYTNYNRARLDFYNADKATKPLALSELKTPAYEYSDVRYLPPKFNNKQSSLSVIKSSSSSITTIGHEELIQKAKSTKRYESLMARYGGGIIKSNSSTDALQAYYYSTQADSRESLIIKRVASSPQEILNKYSNKINTSEFNHGDILRKYTVPDYLPDYSVSFCCDILRKYDTKTVKYDASSSSIRKELPKDRSNKNRKSVMTKLQKDGKSTAISAVSAAAADDDNLGKSDCTTSAKGSSNDKNNSVLKTIIGKKNQPKSNVSRIPKQTLRTENRNNVIPVVKSNRVSELKARGNNKVSPVVKTNGVQKVKIRRSNCVSPVTVKSNSVQRVTTRRSNNVSPVTKTQVVKRVNLRRNNISPVVKTNGVQRVNARRNSTISPVTVKTNVAPRFKVRQINSVSPAVKENRIIGTNGRRRVSLTNRREHTGCVLKESASKFIGKENNLRNFSGSMATYRYQPVRTCKMCRSNNVGYFNPKGNTITCCSASSLRGGDDYNNAITTTSRTTLTATTTTTASSTPSSSSTLVNSSECDVTFDWGCDQEEGLKTGYSGGIGSRLLYNKILLSRPAIASSHVISRPAVTQRKDLCLSKPVKLFNGKAVADNARKTNYNKLISLKTISTRSRIPADKRKTQNFLSLNRRKIASKTSSLKVVSPRPKPQTSKVAIRNPQQKSCPRKKSYLSRHYKPEALKARRRRSPTGQGRSFSGSRSSSMGVCGQWEYFGGYMRNDRSDNSNVCPKDMESGYRRVVARQSSGIRPRWLDSFIECI